MRHALIVDDSITACRILERKLSRLNVGSKSVLSAAKAFVYLEGHSCDVIFMDHNMPEMDGLEAVKILQDNPKTAAIPVLMYTSEDGEYYVSQAMSLGAMDVLPKELGSDYISSALAKLGLVKARDDDDSSSAEVNLEHVEDEQPQPATEGTDVKSQLSSDKIIQTVVNEVRGFVRHINQRMKRELYITNVDIQQGLEDHMDRQHAEFIKILQQQNEQLLASQQLQRQSLQNVGANLSTYSRIASFCILILFAALFYNVQQLQVLKAVSDKGSVDMAALELNLREYMHESIQNMPAGISLQDDDNVGLESPTLATVSLQNTEGNAIGQVIQWDEKTHTLLVMNDNNYLFKVSPEGMIVSPLPTRFYAQDECFGDAFVESFKGAIFVDAEKTLWYTPIEQAAQRLQPVSAKGSQGQCSLYAGGEVTVTTVQRNFTDDTGIVNTYMGQIDGFSELEP